jgi:hypothetical protein
VDEFGRTASAKVEERWLWDAAKRKFMPMAGSDVPSK